MAVLFEKTLREEWKKDNFPHFQRAVLGAHRQVFWDVSKKKQHFICEANELHYFSSRTWWLQSKAAPPHPSRISLTTLCYRAFFLKTVELLTRKKRKFARKEPVLASGQLLTVKRQYWPQLEGL